MPQYNPTKILSFPDMGIAIFAKFDADEEVYNVFSDSACTDYIGCGATMSEAKAVGREFCEELMS